MPVFDKEALTLEQQLNRWKSRGLQINDQPHALRYLNDIGYYRFSFYTKPFQTNSSTHDFKDGTTFNDILALYIFDRQLRVLMIDAIERIEVSIRTRLGNHMAVKYNDPFWYTLPDNFGSIREQASFIGHIGRDLRQNGSHMKKVFIKHYYDAYGEPDMPPSWMMIELLSFGQVSRLIQGIKKEDRKEIASSYEVPEMILKSWLHSVSAVRNICAHHERLWDNRFSVTPKENRDNPIFAGIDKNHFFAQTLIIKWFLDRITEGSTWVDRLVKLIEGVNVDKQRMGFPEDWKRHLGI